MFDRIFVIKYSTNREVFIVHTIFTDAEEAQEYASARFDDNYVIAELDAKDILLGMSGLY